MVEHSKINEELQETDKEIQMENYDKRGECYFVDGNGFIGTSIDGIIDFWGGGEEGTSLNPDYFKNIKHLVKDSYKDETSVAIQYYIPRTNAECPIEYRLIKLFNNGECIIFCEQREYLSAFQYLISREYNDEHEIINLRRLDDISSFEGDSLILDFNTAYLLDQCKQREAQINHLEDQVRQLQISKEAESSQLKAKLQEYEKKNNTSFYEYVTYDNVVKEIAKTDSEQKRSELIDFFRILLPKISTSDFMRDIKRKRREIEKEEEEENDNNANTVIHIQTLNNNGTITGDLKDPTYER